MRLRNRGLLVDGIDRDLYAARPELESALLDPVLSRGNVLVVGGPGAGKTTALRKLAADLGARGRHVAFVNALPLQSARELLAGVASALGLPEGPPPSGTANALRRLAAVDPACVLVDGPLPREVAREVFGRHRDDVWALEHSWAVSTTPNLARPLQLPPADAFWDRVIELPPLSAAEVDDLLRRGLEDDELEDVRMVWTVPDQAWPRPVVRGVRATLEGTSTLAADDRDRLGEARTMLSRGAAMTLIELEGLRRPAAASDPELLERLGYSRAYTSRALAELEDVGLVTSIIDPDAEGKMGRPRKLYAPVGELT